MGMIPLPVFLARRKAPSLKGLMVLVLDRVPSGKSRMEQPFSISATACEKNWAPERIDSRLILMELVNESAIPTNGSLKFSDFEVHLKGLRSLERARISISDRWLATITTGRFHGIFFSSLQVHLPEGNQRLIVPGPESHHYH